MNFRTHQAEARKVCARIEGCGRRAIAVKGDVSLASEVVVMLARNGYITGQTINVNRSWYMS